MQVNGFNIKFHDCGKQSYYSARRVRVLNTGSTFNEVYTRKNLNSLTRFLMTKPKA